MEKLMNYLPLLAPVVLIEIGLMLFALLDLIRRPRVRGGRKWVWALVIVLINFIGPIVYFVAGRQDE